MEGRCTPQTVSIHKMNIEKGLDMGWYMVSYSMVGTRSAATMYTFSLQIIWRTYMENTVRRMLRSVSIRENFWFKHNN